MVKKQKVKVIYREKKIVEVDKEKKAKDEIERLEALRQKNIEESKKAKEGQGRLSRIITGFQYGLSRGAINKDINQNKKFIRAQQAVRNIKSAVEFEKAKTELRELRKRNTVNYDDIAGWKPSGAKQVKFEDLF